MGLVYGFVGLFDESVAELEQATRLDRNNILARNDLALTYTMLGRYDEAKDGVRACSGTGPAERCRPAQPDLPAIAVTHPPTRAAAPGSPPLVLLLLPCLLLWRVVFLHEAFVPADLLRDVAPWRRPARLARSPGTR